MLSPVCDQIKKRPEDMPQDQALYKRRTHFKVYKKEKKRKIFSKIRRGGAKIKRAHKQCLFCNVYEYLLYVQKFST